jgi:predicted dehydrogenase
MPLRWGILGCGNIARTVAGGIRSAPGCELYGVASRSAERAAAFARQTGATRAFGDYRALLECPEIDVVYVATPPSRHADDCLLCLDHGKHVLCEKPFTVNAAQARSVAKRARECGRFLMEAMWTRFLPATEHAERLLHDGRIGVPQLLLAGGAFQPSVDPDYYLFRSDLGGGVMRDAGVYLVHAAHWLLGTPVEVRSICHAGPRRVDEQDGVLLGFADGALALLHVSLRATQRPGLELLGSQGSLRLLPPVFNPTGVELSPQGGASQSWEFTSDAHGYRHQILAVAECIRQGRTESPRMPLQLSIEVMESIDRILGSSDPASPPRA